MASRHGAGGGGGASTFAAAAKVLFDSAKKVGVVEPLGGQSSKRYAQQLKKIQSQSRKKGGSLGSVSYKVAEFLATQRTPKVNTVRNSISIAKRVPLIDIPLQQPQQQQIKKKENVKDLEKQEIQKVPTLDFVKKKVEEKGVRLPVLKETDKVVKKGKNESLLVDRLVPTLDFVKTEKKVITADQYLDVISSTIIKEQKEEKKHEETLKPVTVHIETMNATVMEDKNIFETSNTTDLKSYSSVSVPFDHAVTAIFEKATKTSERTVKPSISVPIAKGLTSSGIQRAVDPIQSETISVDVWELQREREIEQLRKSQENAERERLALQREEEHKILGDEWIKSRTLLSPSSRIKDEKTIVLEKMYFSNDWKICFENFEKLISSSKISSSMSKHAVYLMEKRLKTIPLEHRDSVKAALLKELKNKKLYDDVTKFELRHEQGENFLKIYRSASNNVKDNLELFTVTKLVSVLLNTGSWEEAIELVDKSQKRFNDKTGLLELKLLTNARSLNEEATKAIVEYVTKSLTTSEKFGVLHKIQLAKLEKGAKRRSMLSQLINSNEVDEIVYAELLRITSKENIKDVLEEIRKRGLNTEDPAILAILCWKSFDTEDPQALFREISNQEIKTGIRPIHLQTAIEMARNVKSEEVLRLVVQIVKKAPMIKAKYTLKKLLPLLYENNMNKEIVELSDFYSNRVPIAIALPQAVAFINIALKAEGRKPLSDNMEIPIDEQDKLKLDNESNKKTKVTKSSSSTTTITTTGIEVSSDIMLHCAKEKNWEKALAIIQTLPSYDSNKDEAETLTLIYNCALSAAVEKPEIINTIYTYMKEREIPINATTNNAILSSMMRASQWEEAIIFYKNTHISCRDANTYAVMLSLLGKAAKWEEAVEIYKNARIEFKKTPIIVYTLAIHAICNHSWSETWSIFQEMRKEHGIKNIKDSVVDKVVRCLSQNKRTVELQKLEVELSKAKKK